ncbi:MAG TPA: NUDIX pyrophosphatase [Ktedonobacteraceae bacterium]
MSGSSQEKVQLHPRSTPVVTNFLLRMDGPSPRLLLVRRSGHVGSYRARWAGISGFLEPGVSPEDQAYTEIREETGLLRPQVRLLKRGQIVEYLDVDLGRRWQVHPFLAEVLAPEAIRLDWEAEELRWITFAELGEYETVPRLQEAFLSAYHGVALASS